MRRVVFLLPGIALLVAIGLLSDFSADTAAGQEYTFNLEEFESKPFEWGGYAEIKYERLNLNTDAALYLLKFHNDPHDSINRYSGALQLEMNYSKGIGAFKGVFNTESVLDELEWSQRTDVFEACLSLMPTPSATFDFGKKTFRWGKGYAWNPIGFIHRPKDPNNPEEALEGYIGAGVDLIQSLSGPLQIVALTAVALPAWEGVNEDFGEVGHMNIAAKLYLLYRDTDIDIAVFCGESKTTRYGIDFSRNLASNFEIHAEYAYLNNLMQNIIDAAGMLSLRERSVSQYLVGLRYLTENEITTIVEYYHNGAGFTADELDRFYALADDALAQLQTSGTDILLRTAKTLSVNEYGGSQVGRNYLYLKVNQKEPFDILYLTPGLVALVNLDDRSYSISPELVYTGFTNWEIRLRYTQLMGSDFTEFAEKQNENKIELRVRYYF